MLHKPFPHRLLTGLIPLAGALALPALAEDRLVPQDYPTIQAAINAANHGDTVIVADGTHTGPGNRSIRTLGKAITVRSENGPDNCVIDATGGQYEGVFLINNNETADTVIDGFTITGGYTFNGGGIQIQSGSPVIQNCIITGNRCDCWGAGVYSVSRDRPTLINCVITGNDSAAEGGGVFTIQSPIRIENCVISENTANLGGGICVFSGNPEFVNCQITDNVASGSGGGAYAFDCKLINCTVAGNSATWDGGGLITSNGRATITNSIFWNNQGQTHVTGNPTISYSIVEGGAPGIGNKSSAPRFINAAAGDYRVRTGSPAIDAGSNAAVPQDVTAALNGAPRFLDDPQTVDTGLGTMPIVDMGAFEFRRLMLNAKLR